MELSDRCGVDDLPHLIVIIAKHRVCGKDARDDERDQRHQRKPLHDQEGRIHGHVVGSELRAAERESEEEEEQRGSDEGNLPGVITPLEANDLSQHTVLRTEK